MTNLIFGGFCMALADCVPGVSGGTILFLFGIYDKFIESINSIISRDELNRKNGIRFLIKLALGWAVGFCIGIYMIVPNFENHIYKISSLFIGFIVFSIPIIMQSEKENIIDKYYNAIFSVVGIAIAVLITYFSPMSSSNVYSMNFKSLNIWLMIYIMIVAILVVSAMILPGISGSTLLLIFGLYLPIMKSFRNILRGDFSGISIVLVYAVGLIIGVFTCTKVVKYLLEKYTSQMMYIILGLMVGSIYSIVMGPTTIDSVYNYAPVSISNFNVIFFIIGGILIYTIQYIKKLTLKKSESIKINHL
ncbi:DUF368 domain-containing protein [Intestinibacter sp.]|uniref:DUF368 domain-containing protein n=1 Tax=Intestinibacter sp. TaxID=1965304 RepID=UPI003F14D435